MNDLTTLRNEFLARPVDGLVNLAGYDTGSTPFAPKKSQAEAQVRGELAEALFDGHELLYAEGRRSLLLVLQGLDASGKNGTIKHVVISMNPAAVRTASFVEPGRSPNCCSARCSPSAAPIRSRSWTSTTSSPACNPRTEAAMAANPEVTVPVRRQARGARAKPPIKHWLKAWPWSWHAIGMMMPAFVALTASFTLAGFVVTSWFEDTDVGAAEVEVSKDLEANRTETWNTVAEWASVPSNTFVKIGVVAVLMVVFPLLWKRWHDWSFLAAALILEVSVYGLSSYLVGRPRPPVERLSSAPTQSFPSGHMAASIVFYFGLALVVGWHTERRGLRDAAFGVAGLITAGMFFSRLYLGMHYVSDLLAGIVLGVATLVITLRILRNSLREQRDGDAEPWPDQAVNLDA